MKKNKMFVLITSITLLAFTGAVTCVTKHKHNLHKELQSIHPFLSTLLYKDRAISLDGNSLVLHNVSHPEYPGLTIRRLQVSDNATQFKFLVTDAQGSLIHFFQQTNPHAFKNKLLGYSLPNDLLQKPFISLAICGYDTLNTDISLIAERSSHNQVVVDLIFKNKGKLQAHFTSQFAPQQVRTTIGEYLQNQTISMRPVYLNTTLLQCFLNYTHSKDQPLTISGHAFPFRLQK